MTSASRAVSRRISTRSRCPPATRNATGFRPALIAWSARRPDTTEEKFKEVRQAIEANGRCMPHLRPHRPARKKGFANMVVEMASTDGAGLSGTSVHKPTLRQENAGQRGSAR